MPAEYKEHLLKYNGGQCTPNVFKFNENGNWTESCIDWFLTIYVNINIASVAGNFAMPGSAFGSSILGNSFSFNLTGYTGVSFTVSGNIMVGNILLGYGGNLISNSFAGLAGRYLNAGLFPNSYISNIHGNVISGSTQFINELANEQ